MSELGSSSGVPEMCLWMIFEKHEEVYVMNMNCTTRFELAMHGKAKESRGPVNISRHVSGNHHATEAAVPNAPSGYGRLSYLILPPPYTPVTILLGKLPPCDCDTH